MIKLFIVMGLFFTVCGGWMFGLMLVGGLPQKDEWGKKILAAVLSLVIGFAISGALCLEEEDYERDWNGGVCPNCGTEWRFVNADYVRNQGTTYYYTCDNCGKIIEQKGH